jgi:hypothetical protein
MGDRAMILPLFDKHIAAAYRSGDESAQRALLALREEYLTRMSGEVNVVRLPEGVPFDLLVATFAKDHL